MRILILAGARSDAPITRQTLAALETLEQQKHGLLEVQVRVASNADDARVMAEGEAIDAMFVMPGAATARQIERLAMRTGLFATVHALRGASPNGRGFDIVVVGDPFQGQSDGERGVVAQRYELVGANTLRYTETSIRRIAKVALDVAQRRGRRLTSVDQADRLETMELWRDVVAEAAGRYADIAIEHRLVEQAMIELAWPQRFDTIVAGGNLGGILAAQIGAMTGTPSIWARALVGNAGFAIYEIAAAHHAFLGPDVPPDACLPAVRDALSLMFFCSGNDARHDTRDARLDVPVAHERGPLGL